MPSIYSNRAAQTIQCGTCFREFDPQEEDFSKLRGNAICSHCRILCGCNCGEYITDESVAICGIPVHYRDYIYDGEIVTAHAECAADTLIGYLGEDLSYDHSTREEIAVAIKMQSFLAMVSR